MKQNRLNKDQKEELFGMYKTYQYSYNDLAKYFGKSINSIACLLNREGLTGKREYNHFRKYPINQNYFDEINTEEKAYFLGLLCADGCNHKNNTKVSMWLKESDREILEKFKKALQPTKPLNYGKKENGSNQYGIQISNKRISDKLNELGCIPQKTFTLDLANYDQVPENLFKHYLRGFFDGDGWLGKKDISITSSELFCKKLSNMLLEKFNMKTRLRYKNKVVELCFNRHATNLFLKWIYEDSTVFLERKYQRYLKYYTS
jgi:hypothetical protein